MQKHWYLQHRIKKIDDYENIHSVNPLYLTVPKVIRNIKEKMILNI